MYQLLKLTDRDSLDSAANWGICKGGLRIFKGLSELNYFYFCVVTIVSFMYHVVFRFGQSFE